ncbi:MAG: hypothetical protein HQ517_13060, partial [SAR324 cluster bacterium]|nr:hypothetical protein [SAR324 cluster bacterium]
MDDEELKSDLKDVAPIPRKGRKIKWFLSFFVIILICALALFGLVKFGYVNLPPSMYSQVEKLMEGSFDTVQVESLANESRVATSPSTIMPLKPALEKDPTESQS